MNNLLRKAKRKEQAKEYPSEETPGQRETIPPISATEREEPAVPKAARRLKASNGYENSIKSSELSQASTGCVSGHSGAEGDAVVNGFPGTNAPGASFSISQPSISPYGSLGLPQPLAAATDDDNNSIVSKGHSKSRRRLASQTLEQNEDGSPQASWRTLGEGESMVSSRVPRTSSQRHARNANNKSSSFNPSTSRSEHLSDGELDPSRTLRGAKAVLRRHANHAPNSSTNRSSRSHLSNSERRHQSPSASSGVLDDAQDDGSEQHGRSAEPPRMRRHGRGTRKASSNNSRRSRSNSQLPRERTSPAPLLHLTLNSSVMPIGGDPSTNTVGSSVHPASGASTMRPTFTQDYASGHGGNNKSSHRPPSCASTTAFNSLTTLDDDSSNEDDAEDEEQHEKNLDQLMQHLARYTKSPTPPAVGSATTSLNGEDGGAGTTSWTGVGGSVRSSHAASLHRSGSEADTTATTATTGWTGVGGFGMSSDDWYTRMRQKAKEEESREEADSNGNATAAAASASANANGNTGSVLTPVTEETSTDWYARMRQKVVQEEKQAEKKEEAAPVEGSTTPAGGIPRVAESSEDWYARMRRKVLEEEKQEQEEEKAAQESMKNVAKSEDEGKGSLQATLAAPSATVADVSLSTPSPPNLSAHPAGERYRRPEPPRRPRRPLQVDALPSDLDAAKEQLARSDVLPNVSPRPDTVGAGPNPGPALAPTSPEYRPSWYQKPILQTRPRSSTTCVNTRPTNAPSVHHSAARTNAIPSSGGGSGSTENALPSVVAPDAKAATVRASSEAHGCDRNAAEWSEANASSSVNLRNSAGELGKAGLIASASGRNSSSTVVNQRMPNGHVQRSSLLRSQTGENDKVNGNSTNLSPQRQHADSPNPTARKPGAPSGNGAGAAHRTQGTLVYRTPMKNKKAAVIARVHSRDEKDEDCVLSCSNQNLNAPADVPVVARTAR